MDARTHTKAMWDGTCLLPQCWGLEIGRSWVLADALGSVKDLVFKNKLERGRSRKTPDIDPLASLWAQMMYAHICTHTHIALQGQAGYGKRPPRTSFYPKHFWKSNYGLLGRSSGICPGWLWMGSVARIHDVWNPFHHFLAPFQTQLMLRWH